MLIHICMYIAGIDKKQYVYIPDDKCESINACQRKQTTSLLILFDQMVVCLMHHFSAKIFN